MPQVIVGQSGTTTRQQSAVAQYLCDWPGCENVAKHVTGVVREFGLFAAVCKEHAALQRTKSPRHRVRKHATA